MSTRNVTQSPAEARFRAPAWSILLDTAVAAVVSTAWFLLHAVYLSVFAAAYAVASFLWFCLRALGRTVLTPAGVSSRYRLRRKRMAWTDLWVIETVTGIRSRYVVVKGDHGRGIRLAGVIESRRRPAERFAAQLATLNDFAQRSGNRYRSKLATVAPRWEFAVWLSILLAVGLVLEHAWYWLPQAQAVALPDPCQTVAPAVATALGVTEHGTASIRSDDGRTSGPMCVLSDVNTHRYIQIGYLRFDRTGIRSGTLRAIEAYHAETYLLAKDQGLTTYLGDYTVPAAVGDDAEMQNELGVEDAPLDQVRLIARKANVLIWVSVRYPPHDTAEPVEPDKAAADAVLSVARPAIDAIQLS